MTAWVLSKSLSRGDMAIATGLAESRVDQIVRETFRASGSGKVEALMAQDKGLTRRSDRVTVVGRSRPGG